MREYKTAKSRIIHPKAIKIFRSEFSDFEEFAAFRQKSQKQVFIDIPEEVEAQMR